VFDEDNLVSCAGLVPVMALAEQAGLTRLLDNNIHITSTRVKSGAANPAPKLATLIAGMCAGADYIDDVDLVRAGGMKTLFGPVYAPSTVGTLLREFTFGHARQLDSVLAEHLAGLCEQASLLPGSDVRAFVDIDSLVRPVYGHAKQGASYGHTKIAGKQGEQRQQLSTGTLISRGFDDARAVEAYQAFSSYLLGHLLRGSCAARCVHRASRGIPRRGRIRRPQRQPEAQPRRFPVDSPTQGRAPGGPRRR